MNAALVNDAESGRRRPQKRGATYFTMRILAQAFTMTFLAEWGDRSQLTTIILAASKVGRLITTSLLVYKSFYFTGRLWRHSWRYYWPLHLHWPGCDWRSSSGFQNLCAHCHHCGWHCVHRLRHLRCRHAAG